MPKLMPSPGLADDVHFEMVDEEPSGELDFKAGFKDNQRRDWHGRWVRVWKAGDKNWLGEPMQMSRIRRRGQPPTPVINLVSTGQPDMEHYADPSLGRLLVPGQGTALETSRSGVPWAADNGGFWGVDEAKYKDMIQRFKDEGAHPLWVTAPDVLIHPWDITVEADGVERKISVKGAGMKRKAAMAEVRDRLHDEGVKHVLTKKTEMQPVYGDAEGTIERFGQWSQYLRSQGMPVAFVAQDGMDKPENLKWLDEHWDQIDAIFIGGSDDFKLGPAGAKITDLAHEHGKLVHVGRVNSPGRISYVRDVMHADSFDGSQWSKFKKAKLPNGIHFTPTGEAPPLPSFRTWIEKAERAHREGLFDEWPEPV